MTATPDYPIGLDAPGSALTTPWEIVVVAASAGGPDAVFELLRDLPSSFPLPIVLAQHISPHYRSQLPEVIGWRTALPVKWAEDGEPIGPGKVYVIPPELHLGISASKRFAVREYLGGRCYHPSANLLFETAAQVFGAGAVGVVLSGLLNDGAAGIAAIKAAGGLTMAQSEASSQFFDMPAAAIDFGKAELIGSPRQLGRYLNTLLAQPLWTPEVQLSSGRTIARTVERKAPRLASDADRRVQAPRLPQLPSASV